jgi:fatty acid kinase fatty acid binding subunit
MSGVYLVTDSSSDLVADEIEPFDVEIVPLSIRFGAEEFTDRADLTVDEFYARMASSDELPQTACPSPGAFEGAFRRAEHAGADAVVCLTISSQLSNTTQSALTAAAGFDGRLPVHVVDTKSVSSGLGTMVLEAARLARGGAGVGTVRDLVNRLVDRTHVLAALNTLDNLKKGGRIGGAKALMASVLSIKPLIDVSGGIVGEAGRPRTRSKALHLLAERLLAAGDVEDVAVMHGRASDLDVFLDLIASRFPRTAIRIGELGAVIGAHGGPGIIGVSWVDAG